MQPKGALTFEVTFLANRLNSATVNTDQAGFPPLTKCAEAALLQVAATTSSLCSVRDGGCLRVGGWSPTSVMNTKSPVCFVNVNCTWSPADTAATCCARGSIMWSNLAAVSSSRGIVDAEGR